MKIDKRRFQDHAKMILRGEEKLVPNLRAMIEVVDRTGATPRHLPLIGADRALDELVKKHAALVSQACQVRLEVIEHLRKRIGDASGEGV